MITRTQAQEIAQGMIAHEQCRQEVLKNEGIFKFTCFDSYGLSSSQKLAVLMEETGEVARCVMARERLNAEQGESSNGRLMAELVQVCAVAQSWIEGVLISESRAGDIDVQSGRRTLEEVLDPRD
jgi:NTP pyrophosphatase (non-canonical NTP hydrolase)